MAYLVTAKCENDRCKTRLFQLKRERMTFMSSQDTESIIQSVICPDCGGWANVISNPKLNEEPEREVA